MKYEMIIGLEIHVQLKTKSKMFSPVPNDSYKKPVNTLIDPIILGHPGTLPAVNEKAIHFAIKAGIALHATIAEETKFDRKNYFYPDLPKGYQISQFDKPIALGGYVEVPQPDLTVKKFRLTRLHLEEDAAKSSHSAEANMSLIDFNRAGTPLIEIVTEPDFRSPQDAREFLQELRLLLRYLNVSDADMEKGQLRCDANISLRKPGDTQLYAKTEVKNMNSFKSVERALMYEAHRQEQLWDEGTPPMTSTTRGWDDSKGITVEQRSKEESHDYRYFPEPDIPLLTIEPELIDSIKATIPELPAQKRSRLIREYGLGYDDVMVLAEQPHIAEYIEDVVSEAHIWHGQMHIDDPKKEELWIEEKSTIVKAITNWVLNKLPIALDKKNLTFEKSTITPENFAELIALVHTNKVNSSAAQTILEHMVGTGGDPTHIMDDLGLTQIDSKAELEDIVKKTLELYPEQTEQFRQGKDALLKFLVGMVMKESKGKANPQMVEEIIKDIIV